MTRPIKLGFEHRHFGELLGSKLAAQHLDRLQESFPAASAGDGIVSEEPSMLEGLARTLCRRRARSIPGRAR
jgi:hypothetical protein